MKHHKTFARWVYGMVVKDPQNHMWISHFYFVRMDLSWSIWKLMHLAWDKSGWLYPYVVCFFPRLSQHFKRIAGEKKTQPVKKYLNSQLSKYLELVPNWSKQFVMILFCMCELKWELVIIASKTKIPSKPTSCLHIPTLGKSGQTSFSPHLCYTHSTVRIEWQCLFSHRYANDQAAKKVKSMRWNKSSSFLFYLCALFCWFACSLFSHTHHSGSRNDE